ncbi:hypothetical protein AUJ17_00835 [Candidatus Micrarchaeota archaeon CG1_02_47_40]|nr:MAG: hypothetical protein AUJ17_00835 [Candidatus Micrarchaeota archaeon CG1_02_47_40]
MKEKTGKEPSWDEIGKAIGTKMETGCKEGKCGQWNVKEHARGCGSGGAFYGMGFLGALFYYLSTATSLWMGIIGVAKAIFWPAVLVYELMKFLAM